MIRRTGGAGDWDRRKRYSASPVREERVQCKPLDMYDLRTVFVQVLIMGDNISIAVRGVFRLVRRKIRGRFLDRGIVGSVVHDDRVVRRKAEEIVLPGFAGRWLDAQGRT